MEILLNELNSMILNDVDDVIAVGDDTYYESVMRIAEDIRDNAELRPIVLLSGPSGSGKTTTAKIIEKALDGWGYETHTLSMDDYFRTLTEEQQRLADENKFDLESPDRVDKDFLNSQLADIADGKRVELPRFDFTKHERVASGRFLERKPNELVILEGIHALNPMLITLPDSQTTRIYVSVRTRIELDDGTLLHPQKVRLMRRMLRDTIQRNRKISHTLKMYDSVQGGEEKYIMPYKHRATHDIDTYVYYEIAVYRDLLLNQLEQLPPDERTADMIKALKEVEPIVSDKVPKTALIREFIGNGQFTY